MTDSTAPPQKQPLATLLWLIAYAVLMAAIIVAMLSARTWAIQTLSSASASDDWQQFRSAAEDMSREGPVKRRVPPSKEPPTLRLLRDHFAASLSAALFFSSAVFFTVAWLARGAMGRGKNSAEARFAEVERESEP